MNHRLCPMFNEKYTSKEMSVQNIQSKKRVFLVFFWVKILLKSPCIQKKTIFNFQKQKENTKSKKKNQKET